MLFNSPEFLLVFLPVVLILFLLLARRGHDRLSVGFLVFASLVFYGWWEPRFLILITGSIVFNFVLARGIARLGDKPNRSKALLVVGITGNLLLLGYFKYANFFLASLATIFSVDFGTLSIILPLAISFFTFQQIAFLVDVHRGQAEEADFLTYCLFVTFFPQLIAGPIVHHSEMMGQFRTILKNHSDVWQNLSIGMTILVIGLFKKVVLAEQMAVWSDRMFFMAQFGGEPSFIEAWVGVLCFTFQIYFDFSGYSDIAIGVARMFGIRLPLNFDAPYKATSIIEFWRRWHMTLSRFLRDYLYIPLGGNRNGPTHRYINLMIVMTLGGLWHGAGWTFVLWGMLHGAYLAINHLFRAIFGYTPDCRPGLAGMFQRLAGRSITLLALAFSWTLFRADSLDSAVSIYSGLFTLNGLVLPTHYEAVLGPLADSAVSLGVVFGSTPTFGGGWQLIWILAMVIFVWAFPSTQEFMQKYKPALNYHSDNTPRLAGIAMPAWRPSIWAGILFGVLGLAMAVKLMQGQTGEFIYFQF
jgi:alginate O-acetyltransferase complex protein AlgI